MSLQEELPSLHELLVKSFQLEEKFSDGGGKHGGLSGTPPCMKKLKLYVGQDCLRKASTCTVLPGINDEELSNDPFVKIALHKLLEGLKEAFLHRWKSISQDKENGERNLECMLGELSYLLNYTWEQLNVGHWKSVPRLWRKLYTCISLLKVSVLAFQGKPYKEIIRDCDMGLLMGEPICDNVLSRIAEEISSKLIAEDPSLSESKTENGYRCVRKENKMANLKNKSEGEFLIETRQKPSLEEFLHFTNSCTPVLLSNIIDHWPAMGKWNVDYIHKVAGFRTVPVEVGQKYTSEDWTQQIMTIDDFINKYMRNGSGNSQTLGQNIGYVAQYHLFHQLPDLGKDIKIPDYCTSGNSGDNLSTEINAWFGPAHTISPTHYDPKHNILVQVFGSKSIRLFPPSESSKLVPHPETSLLFNTSQLDVEQDDLFELYPEMKSIKHCDLILDAGMSLYIPPKWWHYVKSLEPSFSVSFWFD